MSTNRISVTPERGFVSKRVKVKDFHIPLFRDWWSPLKRPVSPKLPEQAPSSSLRRLNMRRNLRPRRHSVDHVALRTIKERAEREVQSSPATCGVFTHNDAANARDEKAFVEDLQSTTFPYDKRAPHFISAGDISRDLGRGESKDLDVGMSDVKEAHVGCLNGFETEEVVENVSCHQEVSCQESISSDQSLEVKKSYLEVSVKTEPSLFMDGNASPLDISESQDPMQEKSAESAGAEHTNVDHCAALKILKKLSSYLDPSIYDSGSNPAGDLLVAPSEDAPIVLKEESADEDGEESLMDDIALYNTLCSEEDAVVQSAVASPEAGSRPLPDVYSVYRGMSCLINDAIISEQVIVDCDDMEVVSDVAVKSLIYEQVSDDEKALSEVVVESLISEPVTEVSGDEEAPSDVAMKSLFSESAFKECENMDVLSDGEEDSFLPEQAVEKCVDEEPSKQHNMLPQLNHGEETITERVSEHCKIFEIDTEDVRFMEAGQKMAAQILDSDGDHGEEAESPASSCGCHDTRVVGQDEGGWNGIGFIDATPSTVATNEQGGSVSESAARVEELLVGDTKERSSLIWEPVKPERDTSSHRIPSGYKAQIRALYPLSKATMLDLLLMSAMSKTQFPLKWEVLTCHAHQGST